MNTNDYIVYILQKYEKNFLYVVGRRVTIIIDDDVEKKIRLIQGKLIQKSKGSMSFSRVINDVLRVGMKNV